MRGYFAAHDFVMVDPPGLQISPGNETHLHAFQTRLIGEDGADSPRYLHTSPEFSMKKLLAAGEQRIASLGHVWRNRERTATHHPEFTMAEWYRAGEPYTAVMDDCVSLLRLAVEVAGTRSLRFKGRQADPFAEPERLSVADAFSRYAGFDLLATIETDGTPSAEKLARQMAEAGIAVPEENNWSYLFTRVLVEKIEPQLGMEHITILDRYPASEAALARRTADDPRVSERFEIYACGVELANGFGELTDAGEQRRRLSAEMDEKARLYGERYPIDDDFLAALALMPDASGIALGFDRLVMLATGATRIDQVMWTPMPPL